MSERHVPNTVAQAHQPGQGADAPIVPARPRKFHDHMVEFFDCGLLLPMLGLLLSLFVLSLVATGSKFNVSEDVRASQQEATEASSASSGPVPF